MPMRTAGEIVIINGPSCSGKTTMSRELQALSSKPYLVTGIDDFLPMFPKQFIGVDQAVQREGQDWAAPGGRLSAEGFEIVIRNGAAGPIINARCGPVGWSHLAGMHRAFAAMARAGSSLIVADAASDVLMYDYCAALKGLTVHLVGVFCPLEELERREAAQAGRGVGAARMQFEKVHVPGEYDFTVDSGKHDAKECGRMILDHVEHHPPQAFARLTERYGDYEPAQFPLQTF
jgi:chloramphenicol 3-O phosphotransferase